MFKNLLKLFLSFLLVISLKQVSAQGNYVMAGSEFVNFSTINLATPGGQTWSTQRTATPGYFSINGTSSFTGAADGTTALIDGYVKHYVTAANQGAVFPVGAGNDLRSLSTSGLIPSGLEVGTAWILGNPTVITDPTDGATHNVASKATGIFAVNTIGQWDWVPSNGNPAGVTLTASIPNVTGFAPANNLRLVGWNGTQWINLSTTQGAAAASGVAENSTLVGTLQSGITALGIGRVTIGVNIKVFLQGAYNGTNMTTTLNTLNLIPLTQPYNTAPFNYSGTETVASIPSNVTDWVLVELRNALNVLVDTRAAFVKNDGSIVDTDGTSSISFVDQPDDVYFIVIKHRNHLSIRTAAVTAVTPSMIQYDYTAAQTQAFQDVAITRNPAMKEEGGVFLMWAGNANSNNTVRYAGPGSDLVTILAALGGNNATVLSNVYNNADLNLNGNVRYAGPANDELVLLSQVLGGNNAEVFTRHN